MGSLLRSYVKILTEAQYETNQVKMVKELFQAAGAKREPVDDTVSSWLTKGGNCRVTDYFENGKIDEEGKKGIINYFRSKSYIQWEDLQKKFAASKEEFIYVDYETSNQMQFYKSLLNEFLRILKLPIEVSRECKESQHPEKLKKAKEQKQLEKPEETQKERMIDIFDQCIYGYTVEDFIAGDPSGPIKAYLYEDAISVAGRIRTKTPVSDKFNEIDQKIIEFSELLVSYMKSLKRFSETQNLRLDGYRPLLEMDPKTMEEIKCSRDELELFYKSLKEQVEEVLKQEREANKIEQPFWEKSNSSDLL